MNRSELIITIVGLIATFCLPWPCTGEPEIGAAYAPEIMAHLEQDSAASTPWAYVVVERVRPGTPASADALMLACNRLEATRTFLALDPFQGLIGEQRIGENRALTQIDAYGARLVEVSDAL